MTMRNKCFWKGVCFPGEEANSKLRLNIRRRTKSESTLSSENSIQPRMDVIKTQQISARTIEKVIVHPLVLLSIVDHYNRVAKDTRKRVVGVLLGNSSRGTVDVTNSYAGALILLFTFSSISKSLFSSLLIS